MKYFQHAYCRFYEASLELIILIYAQSVVNKEK